jgi:hypothetical protein
LKFQNTFIYHTNFLQVFLIYPNLKTRYPPNEPFGHDELAINSRLLDAYFTFATTNKPAYGKYPFVTMKNDSKLMMNEIISFFYLNYREIQPTFGNTAFWNGLD